jgi:CRISPR-associated protein Cmr4
MTQYLTYTYLLTPLHTGASTNAGNVMGIAREAHTEFPYIPSSSLRGKIRSLIEGETGEAGALFGKRLDSDQQITEGQIWFADATLLFFPIASFSHQFLWITCPLWLSRWNRWLKDEAFTKEIDQWRQELTKEKDEKDAKCAIASDKIARDQIYIQGARLEPATISALPAGSHLLKLVQELPNGDGILDLKTKLVILSDVDCAALVEMGLQREVRVQLETESKTVKGGSFRSEEAIPSETLMFFPWGLKKQTDDLKELSDFTFDTLNNRIQLGGLEGLGRGWVDTKTREIEQ